MGGALVRLRDSLARVKIWGRSTLGVLHHISIWSSEKSTLGGYDSTSRSPRLLDQTSHDLFRIMREESLSNEYLTDFEYLHPFRRYSQSTEIGPNFACFWPLKIFLDRDYKIERSSEHRAKFRADLPTELGDYARKKRKINSSKT